ncbi:MAG: hypothetical protein M3R15_10445, partial [Acidobacteriota bacterium]|nr:hypothetical protein [Acidobacteriota bacterium]
MKVVPRSLKNILAAGFLLCLMLCSLAPGRERGSNGVKPTISQTPEKAGYYQSPGTKRMAERLAQIYRDQDFRTDPSKDQERADYYRAGLKQNLDLRTELKARLALAGSLLKAGESAAAVSEIESLRRMAEEKGVTLAPFFVKEMRQLLAIAYLRMGEQENCLLHHNRESCIYPIRLSGQHQLKRGSIGAIRELTVLLNEDARDHSARWLLNLAHMTLGEHPQKVPPPWLIPTARFDSEYDIKRFNDVAP